MFEIKGTTGAIFSSCKKYRYALWRIWGKKDNLIFFICLNPSTADEVQNDPTLNKCISYAKNLGFDGMLLGNLFAYRATKIEDMKRQKLPIGEKNNEFIMFMNEIANMTILAWGNHGDHLGRSGEVLNFVSNTYCMETNLGGQPRHPLYLNSELKPKKYP